MPQDTQALNQARNLFGDQQELWLFGYGSLIFKVDFPYIERRPATIYNWTRKFWQGSHDHRGTPQSPGRVATLVEQPGAVCLGMAYRVTPAVFDHLDHREKNGYLRFTTELHFSADPTTDTVKSGAPVQGLVYIASADNAAFLGPTSELEIARHVAASEGPSGPNDEYVLHLADALRELGADDPHVYAIADYLRNDFS
ncbi:gamma-glutamylcyclotransferase [Aliidiomarina maris]|uniref:glutathione-specific gamma-glutamylcyclotransferase n=1 Tax=Aliidiomarina maris TaxID=531312 RepID=A0A327WVN2_9GAMM|nr:gamma-glutamylcyclotransferase [Aliidiomarina maris]MCL5050837.1 gamma-glutamylcyclotransferase [Bacillota bacterium]RAJ96963.1 cation transport regulator ChaC [Aliidiomarina maris]RUO24574.1 gamma-glutamylcyclotransferase [Aliidiomarina maris]